MWFWVRYSLTVTTDFRCKFLLSLAVEYIEYVCLTKNCERHKSDTEATTLSTVHYMHSEIRHLHSHESPASPSVSSSPSPSSFRGASSRGKPLDCTMT